MNRLLRVLLCVTALSDLSLTQDADDTADKIRPYKFGFNIEGYQHRYEEKNEKGIIMGEYGFITGDGVYHLTVYATDENGNFKIIRTKNVYIGLPGEKTTTPVPAVTSQQPNRVQEVIQKGVTMVQGIAGCGGCVIPTTSKPQLDIRAGVEPLRGSEPVVRPLAGRADQQENDQHVHRPTDARSDNGKPLKVGSYGGPIDKSAPLPKLGDRAKEPQNRSSPQSITNGMNIPNPQIQYRQDDTPAAPLSSGKTPLPGVEPTVDQIMANIPKMTNQIRNMADLQALFYIFNYTLTYHGHQETGNRAGDKNGTYFFHGRDGLGRNVSYLANEFGYQPNITLFDLTDNQTPKEGTEKERTALLGNEFRWFYGKQKHDSENAISGT